jgi:hypothetical protein|tara:strand:+ start:479 stop:709 length:231 start_codon:yes stop_codon:yes gene_type:complete
MIEMVFAMLMIQNGNTIEYVPTLGMTDCLQQKRVVSRQIGDEQDGIYLQCQQLKAELYEDCVGDTCRLKIKKIIED